MVLANSIQQDRFKYSDPSVKATGQGQGSNASRAEGSAKAITRVCFGRERAQKAAADELSIECDL